MAGPYDFGGMRRNYGGGTEPVWRLWLVHSPGIMPPLRGADMAQPAVSSVHYVMDRKLSQFTVQAFASGLIAVVGHSPKIAIRDWTGDTKFVPDSIKEAY